MLGVAESSEAELASPALWIPSKDPAFNAAAAAVLTMLPKIRALIWPRLGGRDVIVLSFWRVVLVTGAEEA